MSLFLTPSDPFTDFAATRALLRLSRGPDTPVTIWGPPNARIVVAAVRGGPMTGLAPVRVELRGRHGVVLWGTVTEAARLNTALNEAARLVVRPAPVELPVDDL